MGAKALVCKNCNKYNKYGAAKCAFCGSDLEQINNEAHVEEDVEFKSFIGTERKSETLKTLISTQEHDSSSDGKKFKKIEAYDTDMGKTIVRKSVNPKELKISTDIAKNGFEAVFNGKENENDISFEDKFELNDMSIDFTGKKERLMSREEKITLRNTALIAVILAIVIDIIFVVGMLVYFKGFANKIINVSQIETTFKEEVQKTTESIFEV